MSFLNCIWTFSIEILTWFVGGFVFSRTQRTQGIGGLGGGSKRRWRMVVFIISEFFFCCRLFPLPAQSKLEMELHFSDVPLYELSCPEGEV